MSPGRLAQDLGDFTGSPLRALDHRAQEGRPQSPKQASSESRGAATHWTALWLTRFVRTHIPRQPKGLQRDRSQP
jgi:hypothetical protein